LASMGLSGHHVLGGLILRGLLLLVPLLPHELDDPFCQGLDVLDFLIKFFFLILRASLLTCESEYRCLHLVIKLDISKNRSIMT
jgi:hypothetical protein